VATIAWLQANTSSTSEQTHWESFREGRSASITID
jgi:hypothetical protein